MESLIHTAILMNYLNDDKVRRYQIEIKSGGDRGMINCLSRETKMFCNCMKGKKKEAQGMGRRLMNTRGISIHRETTKKK